MDRGMERTRGGRLPEAISMTMIARDAAGGQFSFTWWYQSWRGISPRLTFINPFEPDLEVQ
jgi:hypothetical protein